MGGETARPGSSPLATLLREWRKRSMLTQEELAAQAGLSVGTIRGLEAGRVLRPRPESVRLLAESLGLDDAERALLTDAVPTVPTGPTGPADSTGPAGPAGPAQQPAAPAGPAVPAELPASTALIGRSRELGLLTEALRCHDHGPVVVAVTGTAGIGKSALAVAGAHRVIDEFPDGQLYLDLRTYAPAPTPGTADALARFLRALGVPPERIPGDADEAGARFRSLLADRRVLVVLDDAASAEQVRPLFPGGRGCAVVVTSRHRLSALVARDGGTRLALGPLDAGPAEDLLAAVVGERRARRERDAIRDLTRACDGLPLALRIAAAHLLDNPDLSIRSYVSRLVGDDARFPDLSLPDEPGSGVRAALDLSYRHLGDDERRLVRRLGLAPGPDFGTTAAAALVAAAPARAEQLLDHLASTHLIRPSGAGRYRFHALLGRYAAERCRAEDAAAERSGAWDRLLSAYLDGARSAALALYPEKLLLAPGQPAGAPVTADEAQRWLEAELPSLTSAAVDAARQGPPEIAWQLADALRGWFWLRTPVVEWEQVAAAAEAASRAARDDLGLACAALSRGDLEWHRCRYDCAAQHYATAIRHSAARGWVPGRTVALNQLGLAQWRMGRTARSAESFAESLALMRRHAVPGGALAVLGNLAAVTAELGDLRLAAGYFREAAGSPDCPAALRASVLAGLGETESMLGEFTTARGHLSAAAELHRGLSNRAAESDTLRALAEVERETGDPAEARNRASVALELARAARIPILEAAALNELAAAEHDVEGPAGPGRALHLRALGLAREHGLPAARAEALLGLGALDVAEGRPAAAERNAREALVLAEESGHLMQRARALALLARALSASGERASAGRAARQAIDVLAGAGYERDRAAARLRLVGVGAPPGR